VRRDHLTKLDEDVPVKAQPVAAFFPSFVQARARSVTRELLLLLNAEIVRDRSGLIYDRRSDLCGAHN
jgi:hypothetical protein